MSWRILLVHWDWVATAWLINTVAHFKKVDSKNTEHQKYKHRIQVPEIEG